MVCAGASTHGRAPVRSFAGPTWACMRVREANKWAAETTCLCEGSCACTGCGRDRSHTYPDSALCNPDAGGAQRYAFKRVVEHLGEQLADDDEIRGNGTKCEQHHRTLHHLQWSAPVPRVSPSAELRARDRVVLACETLTSAIYLTSAIQYSQPQEENRMRTTRPGSPNAACATSM